MKKEAGVGVRRLLPLLSALAGFLNGFLGTGGGMVLALSLRAAYPREEKCAMAISTACVLSFSVLTMILYKMEGHMQTLSLLPILLPSFLGGAVGALLLSFLRPGILDGILGLLLLFSGAALLF